MSSEVLEFAIQAGKEAGAIAQSMRMKPAVLDTRIKNPMDLVTEADHAVETMLRRKIQEAFPADAVLGEEAGREGTSNIGWIIDPIDGTVNFARGMRDWAISIARFEGQSITHGVVHAPDLGLTAWASRGSGSYVNGKPVSWSGARSPCPIVALGYSTRDRPQDYFARIQRLLDAGIEHRRHGAATICILGVITEWFDAFYEQKLNIWDAAAGLLLVTEAGGIVRHDAIGEFMLKPSEVLVHNGKFPELDKLLH